MKYHFYTAILALFLVAFQSNNNNETKIPSEEKIIAGVDTISKHSTLTLSKIDEKVVVEEELEAEMFPRIFEWTGTINGSIDIHGQYQIANGFMDSRMDVLVGEWIYDKVGKPIKLIGKLENGGKNVRLLEMDKKGNITGILSGKWQNGSIVEGTWFSPTKRNDFKLTINARPKEESNYTETRPKNTASIVGKYHYEYGEEGAIGTINVQSVKDNQVDFSLICLTHAPGRNIASLGAEGEKGTSSIISDHTINVSMYENCEFNICFFEDFAVIDYVEDKVDCQFGHNAYVSGIFRKVT